MNEEGGAKKEGDDEGEGREGDAKIHTDRDTHTETHRDRQIQTDRHTLREVPEGGLGLIVVWVCCLLGLFCLYARSLLPLPEGGLGLIVVWVCCYNGYLILKRLA